MSETTNIPQRNTTTMKSKLSVLLAAFIIAPLAFASPCDKKKDCDKVKKDEATLADCGKCKGDKDKDKDKKQDGALLAEGGCGKGKCGTGKCDKEKEEGTLA